MSDPNPITPKALERLDTLEKAADEEGRSAARLSVELRAAEAKLDTAKATIAQQAGRIAELERELRFAVGAYKHVAESLEDDSRCVVCKSNEKMMLSIEGKLERS